MFNFDLNIYTYIYEFLFCENNLNVVFVFVRNWNILTYRYNDAAAVARRRANVLRSTGSEDMRVLNFFR